MDDSATNVISREHITVLESVQILGMSVPAHPWSSSCQQPLRKLAEEISSD